MNEAEKKSVWDERMATVIALDEASILNDRTMMKITGWSKYVCQAARKRLRDLKNPPPPTVDESPGNWGREIPEQHVVCERCNRLKTQRDIDAGRRMNKFRGVMVCSECLMKWIDLPPGRAERHVSPQSKARRMARILAKE